MLMPPRSVSRMYCPYRYRSTTRAACPAHFAGDRRTRATISPTRGPNGFPLIVVGEHVQSRRIDFLRCRTGDRLSDRQAADQGATRSSRVVVPLPPPAAAPSRPRHRLPRATLDSRLFRRRPPLHSCHDRQRVRYARRASRRRRRAGCLPSPRGAGVPRSYTEQQPRRRCSHCPPKDRSFETKRTAVPARPRASRRCNGLASRTTPPP
jgi:hypothetical protein